MTALRKRMLATLSVTALAGGMVLAASLPAAADHSGTRYCSGSQRPTLFTYSIRQVQHIHVNQNNSKDRSSKFSPAGPTNFTTSVSWNADAWYVSGTASGGTPQTSCS